MVTKKKDCQMDLSAYMTDHDIENLMYDLSQLINFGWGEITLTVANKAVTGHKVVVSKKYGLWRNKTPTD